MAGWHSRHGSWWAVHYCLDGFVSLGVHVDPKRRRTALGNVRYGPYVDFHVGPAVLSIGVNPIYTTDDYASWRSGERAGHY